MKRGLKDYLLLFFKGMAMGAVELVPGVSGGSIALITGIYQEFLGSINGFSLSALKKWPKEGFTAFWKNINGSFLVVLFAGMLSSIFSFARLLEWAINNEPVSIWSFFFGLLLASIVYLFKQLLPLSLSTLVQFSIGVIIGFLATKLGGTETNPSLLYLFFCGFIGISAMILPGLSGAYLLFILGVYTYILSNVRELLDLLKHYDASQFFNIATVLGVFILGILVGIKVFAKFLHWLLERHPKATLATLVGLIVGALHKIWPWQNQFIDPQFPDRINTQAVLPSAYQAGDPQLLKAFLFISIGFGLLFLLERIKISKKNATPQS